MKIDQMMLSAYLDGELPPGEAEAVETALSERPDLQAELEALIEADTDAKAHFAALMDDPVPLALADAIRAAPEPRAANTPAPPRVRGGLIAASVAALALAFGAAGGFYVARTTAPELVATRGWLDDIADYHAVYATQVRHLVEVPADEAEHIQTWLTATLGTGVTVPDLSAEGLEFEGARLLVAAGRPVAQLIYTDGAGGVVALCQIASTAPQSGFESRSIGDFDLVSWGSEGAGANFVVISDQGRSDLSAIAERAAAQV
ncbi:MAG: anti-sigma factor [Pseudomonadota bacterium]